jgi:hypothetical protein
MMDLAVEAALQLPMNDDLVRTYALLTDGGVSST